MSESELEGLQCYPFHLPDCVPLGAPRGLLLLSNVTEGDWEKALAKYSQGLGDWSYVSLREPAATERVHWNSEDDARIIEELLELAGIPQVGSPEWVDGLGATGEEADQR